MLQDPLSAIGARLEARLIAQESRFKSVEQTVKENVAASRPAVFTMLPDGTKQFGYAPSAVETLELPSESDPELVPEYGIGMAFTSSVQDEIKAQFIANAPVLKAASELETAAAETEAASEAVDLAAAKPEQIAVNQAFPGAAAPDVPVSASSAANANAAAEATPAATTTPSAPVLPSSASPVAVAATASNSAHVTNTVASSVAASVSANVSANATDNNAGFIVLPDGTKQFGYAPTGGTNIVGPHAQMPVVTPDFGPGATFRLKGIQGGPTMTVTRTGDRLVFANVTDGDGTREMAFVPAHLSLVTAATS